jgi:hypothetical protein
MVPQTNTTFLLLSTGTVYRGTCKQDYRVCVQMNDRNSIAKKSACAKKQYFCEWRWYPRPSRHQKERIVSEPSSTRQYKEQPCLTFEERLQQCPGGPWTIASASTTQTPDTQVVRLHKVIPGRGWCEEATYVDFLDQRIHRQLLDCFVLNTQKLQWSIDELLKQIGPRISRMTLETALLFCEAQGFIVAVKNRTWWSRGPQ